MIKILKVVVAQKLIIVTKLNKKRLKIMLRENTFIYPKY